MKNVMTEIYDEFPELEEKSLDKICKTGLSTILKLTQKREELILKLNTNTEIKFYTPTSQALQSELTFKNIWRRERAALRKQNGEKSK
jgi:hypothetical protein